MSQQERRNQRFRELFKQGPNSGEAVASEGEDDVAPHAAMPDPEFPEDVMPLLNVCDDDLAGAVLDERLTLRKVHAELEALLERTRQGASADKVVQRASQMQFFVRGPLDSARKTAMKAALSSAPSPKAAMLGVHASPLKLQKPKSLPPAQPSSSTYAALSSAPSPKAAMLGAHAPHLRLQTPKSSPPAWPSFPAPAALSSAPSLKAAMPRAPVPSLQLPVSSSVGHKSAENEHEVFAERMSTGPHGSCVHTEAQSLESWPARRARKRARKEAVYEAKFSEVDRLEGRVTEESVSLRVGLSRCVEAKQIVEAAAPLGIGILGRTPLHALLHQFLGVSLTQDLAFIFQDRSWLFNFGRELLFLRLVLGGGLVRWERSFDTRLRTDFDGRSLADVLDALANDLLDTYKAHPSLFLDLELGHPDLLKTIAWNGLAVQERGVVEVRDVRLESVSTVDTQWMAKVVEAAMRVNCLIRAMEQTTALDALERAAALAALLDGLRTSGNRKLHATLLCHPKDVVTLPWEKLNGNDRDGLTTLFAGEVWDGRADKKEFVPLSKHDRVHASVRDFVMLHSGSGADDIYAGECNLANELQSFRKAKRRKRGAQASGR